MKKLLLGVLFAGLLAVPTGKAITVVTTNAPGMGSTASLRESFNQALKVVSNGFERAEFIQTVVETNPVSNTVLSGGDYLYVITTGDTATNLTFSAPSRKGERLSVLSIGTQTVKFARSSGGLILPASTNEITVGPGTEFGLVAPTATNWILRGTYSSP